MIAVHNPPDHIAVRSTDKWMVSTTHKNRVYVFGHNVKWHPDALEYFELGFIISKETS